MDTPNKTKVSSGLFFTRLISFGATILCLVQYLNARKTDDLYTELWFLGIIFFLSFLIYFSTRPKVYCDDSSFYFKKINDPEIQVPFKDIQIIVRNPIHVRGNFTYKIQYLDENRKKARVLFYTDSYLQMQDLMERVSKSNHFVKIV